MPIFSFAHYLTRTEEEDGTAIEWRTEDYAASKFVKAIKRKPINGYAWVRGIKIEDGTKHLADSIFAAWATELINAAGESKNLIAGIVPLPNSTTTIHADGGDAFCARRLANEIAARCRFAVVFDILRWKQPMQKAHEGGTRRASILAENMVVTGRLDGRPLLILDDVATTSGHMKAAARVLRTAGKMPSSALCAGRTALTRPENAFVHEPEHVDIDDE